MPSRDEIPPGTVDMLILTTLSRSNEMHGFEIAEAIQEHSEHVLRVEEGSLYPALQRLLIKAWIADAWGCCQRSERCMIFWRDVWFCGRKLLGSSGAIAQERVDD